MDGEMNHYFPEFQVEYKRIINSLLQKRKLYKTFFSENEVAFLLTSHFRKNILTTSGSYYIYIYIYISKEDELGMIQFENIKSFGLVSLFNGISTFVGYLMPKPFS